MNDQIKARVELVNMVHQELVTFWTAMREILLPYVGRKALTTDGWSLLKRLRDQAPNSTNPNVRIFHLADGFCWRVRGTVHVPHQTVTHEEIIRLGHNSNGILIEVFDLPDFSKNYRQWTVEEVATLKKRQEEIEEMREQNRRDMGPFDQLLKYVH